MNRQILSLCCAFGAGAGLTAVAGLGWRSSHPTAAAPTASPPRVDADAPVPAVTWTERDSEDIRALVQRLRAAGFPAVAAQGAGSALVHQKFLEKRRQLDGNRAPPPFWAKPPPGSKNGYTAALRALMRDETRSMAATFQGDVRDVLDAMSPADRAAYSVLPLDKVLDAHAVRTDYAQMRAEVMAEAEGMMLPQDLEKLRYLEKSEREDLARILAPKDLEEFDLRSSNTAAGMRRSLALFEPTEDEFRAIYAARRDAEDKYGPLGPGQAEQILAREHEVLDRVKGALTPERAAQYAQTTDPSRNTLNRVASRFGLPLATANAVADVQRNTLQQSNQINANRALPAEQRDSQLAAVSQQARTQVADLMGPDAYKAYAQNGGAWMQPRPAPAVARGGPPRPAPLPPPRR